jgi:hypothetical protein
MIGRLDGRPGDDETSDPPSVGQFDDEGEDSARSAHSMSARVSLFRTER